MDDLGHRHEVPRIGRSEALDGISELGRLRLVPVPFAGSGKESTLAQDAQYVSGDQGADVESLTGFFRSPLAFPVVTEEEQRFDSGMESMRSAIRRLTGSGMWSSDIDLFREHPVSALFQTDVRPSGDRSVGSRPGSGGSARSGSEEAITSKEM